MENQVLTATEFYTQEAEYRTRLDPTWEADDWQAQLAEEIETFAAVLPAPDGGRLLDCSCGPGRQAIALARLGWQVTGSDACEAYLETARRRAVEAGATLSLVRCDMRELEKQFTTSFDWIVSCMALDNITSDAGIQRALNNMAAVLRPGGHCYIRLRDMDNLLQNRPRFEFKGERLLPFGRVISLEDWDFESETLVIDSVIYLHEDRRKPDYAWETTIFAYRRRLLRKAELASMLRAAGFTEVEFLPQPNPWHPYSLIARLGES